LVDESSLGTDAVSVTVDLSGVVAEVASINDNAIAGGSYNVTVFEAAIVVDLLLGGLLWELIDNSQTANWGGIDNSQNADWQLVETE
jgi:hypothetical protein